MPIPLSQFEIAPLPGQQPLPNGMSLDSATGLYRCHLSVDATGKVGSPLWGGVANGVITSAQIKNLVASPVTLLPAAGAGTVIIPLFMFFNLRFITTAYAAGGNLDVFWDDGNTASNPLIIDGISQTFMQLDGSAIMYQHSDEPPANAELIANADNHPVLLEMDGVIDFTTGDGTLAYRITYIVVPVA